MAGLRATFENAVAHHLRALGQIDAVRAAVASTVDVPPDSASLAAERELAQRLSAAAAGLHGQRGVVRLGQARLHETSFPVYVPFMGAAHVAMSQDSQDPRAAALVQSILIQTLSCEPPGSVEVLTADFAAVGATFAALQPLVDARLMTAAATDAAGAERVLSAAEEHVRAALRGEKTTKLILAAASLPERSDRHLARLAALARSGVGAGLHIIAGGVSELPDAVSVTMGDMLHVGNPPNAPFGAREGLDVPVECEPAPAEDFLRAESTRIAERARAAAQLHFADLEPETLWQESPADGLSTIAGRDGQGIVHLSFDDATPHWLIGGRTGGGKTVFLLDVLYGLAARYSPQDLALYLLDFKEGVSFTEFTPQESDPTFIPHARAVGVESDREYGVAVLRELDSEMTRRSTVMKRHGVARYSQLSAAEPIPRIVCVVDEFQVLFAGNDKLAGEAAALLENLARKGRSYGVHLVLASQTTAGIEALYAKKESIFGQFPLRVALPGATSVLDIQNTAAQNLRTGEAVINVDGGVAGRDRKIRFPDAHADADALYRLRRKMWESASAAVPPTVFYGYAAVHVEDDPEFTGASPKARRPRALLGRRVDAGLGTAGVEFDPAPGRHLAILGSDPVGAHVLDAATRSLARQQPQARFLIAGLAETDAAAATTAALAGQVESIAADKLAETVDELAAASGPAYLIGYGLDAANLDVNARNALRSLLRAGPAQGIHLLGWWRGLRRFSDDIGGSMGREDVSCALILNVPGGELISHFGQEVSDWNPRPGRALLVDRHSNTRELVVPFSTKEAEPA